MREAVLTTTPQSGPSFTPHTQVALVGDRWHLNGRVTYPGSRAEGLLMNVRMVNSVFEDRARPDFNPEANSERFLRRIPDYAAQGVRAFTICLQGGMPGYEGAINSAFRPDGSLRASYLQRVRRVIETCDRQGIVVILGCYYQRQDQILNDEAAVRAGVVNVTRWVQECGFTNVLLEIANEFPHPGFDHRILRTAEWAFALSCPHGPYPAPTAAHLRMQVYSNLAYGAQVIQYFTYWTPEPKEFNFHDGPITPDGKRTATYDRVKQMNREIQALRGVFLGAKVLSVGHTGAKLPQGTRPYQPAAPVKKVKTGGQGALVAHLPTKEELEQAAEVEQERRRLRRWPSG